MYALLLFLILYILLYFGMLVLISHVADSILPLLSKGIHQVIREISWLILRPELKMGFSDVLFSIILTVFK